MADESTAASAASHDPSDGKYFRSVLGNFPTGVTVVAAVDDDQPVGMAIGSFTSVSLDPPLVAFCPGKDSKSWARIERAGGFCVNVLADDQVEVSNTFAGSSTDKFAQVAWTPCESGRPRLDEALAWIDCETEAVVEGGDHWIVLGRVRQLEIARPDVGPLLFFRGGYGRFSE